MSEPIKSDEKMDGKRLVRFRCGLQLQVLRVRAGLTQQQLADVAGVHVQTVKFWEGQKHRELNGGLFGNAINRMAFLMEVLATSAPHYRTLRGEPNTALPLEVAEQMDTATRILRTGKAG